MSYNSVEDYRISVQEDAESIVKEENENDGTLPSGCPDQYYDRAHERADSEVTWSCTCDAILMFSHNGNALFECMGRDALEGLESKDQVSQRLAYYAYYQDLSEALHGIDDEKALSICGYDHECPSEYCSERYKEETEAENCCNIVERVANA